MKYLKKEQTKKVKPTHKACKTCKKKRAIKFFTSSRALICSDCKRKKWAKDLRNSPGKVNKRKDKKWADAVKRRAGYKCEYCGSTIKPNAHHIFSRSNRTVRWDLDNGITLCPKHHVFNMKFSAHKTPLAFAEWIKNKRGQDWYDKLKSKAIKTIKEL